MLGEYTARNRATCHFCVTWQKNDFEMTNLKVFMTQKATGRMLGRSSRYHHKMDLKTTFRLKGGRYSPVVGKSKFCWTNTVSVAQGSPETEGKRKK